MEDLIKDLQGQLAIETVNYNNAVMKMEAGEANYPSESIQKWEERISAYAQAIAILTKHLNK